MKTRLNIDVSSEELEAQIKEFLEVKLFHIAKGNLAELVTAKHKELLSNQIEEILNKRISKEDTKDAVVNAFETTVDKMVKSRMYDTWNEDVSKMIKEVIERAVTRYIETEIAQRCIDKYIDDYLRSEIYKKLKAKIDNMLGADKGGDKE